MSALDSIASICASLGAVAIPFVLAVLGNKFAKSMKEKDIQGRYVELAVDILKGQPSDQDRNIRGWATIVINRYSGVPLDEATKNDLIERIPLVQSKVARIYGNLSVPEPDSGKLRVKNHFLIGKGVEYELSPNTSGPQDVNHLRAVILSFSASGSLAKVLSVISGETVQASMHLIIDRDGKIVQMVPFNFVAWSSGISAYRGVTGFNDKSISVQLVNWGRLRGEGGEYFSLDGDKVPENEVEIATHKNEVQSSPWHKYTQEQVDSAKEVCKLLVKTYKIEWILGKDDISPGRKFSPGPAFPLEEIKSEILGKS